MRSLYLKIFLGFWLVMMLVIGANMAVTWILVQQFEASDQRTEHISSYADQALAAYTTGGEQGLRDWRRQLQRDTGLRVLLLDGRGRSLTGEPTPPRMHRFMEPHDHRDGPPRRFDRRPVRWPMSRDGRDYTFVILNPQELLDHLYSRTTLIWRLGLSVLIVAGIALLMTRYLVRPIRRLQSASRQLADGNLQARAGTGVTARRDELGELGRDFDRMAERLQRLVEGQQQLLRDVSHELRTPLARQRVALELARKRGDSAEALDRIEREAERLDELIGEILLLVRMNGDTPETPRERCDLGALLQALTEDANFESRRVTLRPCGPLHCRLNPRQIHRAVENVVRNALKYSGDRVEVSLERAGDQALIRVADRGPGIPEAMLEQVFEPFYRTDQARTRESGGWGLGLAIAARAVHLHGGEIAAANREGGGLEVSVRLPLDAD